MEKIRLNYPRVSPRAGTHTREVGNFVTKISGEDKATLKSGGTVFVPLSSGWKFVLYADDVEFYTAEADQRNAWTYRKES